MIVFVLMLIVANVLFIYLAYRESKMNKEYEIAFFKMRKEILDLRQEKESLRSRLSRKGIKMPKREKK